MASAAAAAAVVVTGEGGYRSLPNLYYDKEQWGSLGLQSLGIQAVDQLFNEEARHTNCVFFYFSASSYGLHCLPSSRLVSGHSRLNEATRFRRETEPSSTAGGVLIINS